MKIIDAHAHIFPDKIAQKAAKSIGDFYGLSMYSDASSKSLVHHEEKIEIERVLVCSSALVPTQVESINDFIHKECLEHKEFIGFASMHRDYENFEEELDRVKEMGLYGVKFHHDMQQISIDDPKQFPIYKAMSDRGLKLLLHMGDDRYDYTTPKRMLHIAKEFEDLQIIASHFGGYRRWEEAYAIPRLENVHYDTSSTLFLMNKDTALRFIDHFGPDRYFFGTDFPMWNPEQEIKRFMKLGLDDSTNQMILYDNFKKFLNLPDEIE